MLVFGHDILDSERNLDVIRNAFRLNPNAEIKIDEEGSFTVWIK